MKDVKALGSAALASIFAIGLASSAQANPDWAAKGVAVEKCAGVAKAGKNDCGTNAHGCAGQAKTDNDQNEWVYTPKGVCDKIGGKVAAAAPAKKKKKK